MRGFVCRVQGFRVKETGPRLRKLNEATVDGAVRPSGRTSFAAEAVTV